jgi:hypothetical protein
MYVLLEFSGYNNDLRLKLTEQNVSRPPIKDFVKILGFGSSFIKKTVFLTLF